MKFLVQVVFIAILAFFLELFLPWWSIAIAAFIGGLIFNTKANFGAGFMAVALLWMAKAFLLHNASVAPLADRVAQLLFMNAILLIVTTGVIGGLVGGLAGMTGAAVHRKRKRRTYY